MVIVADFRCTVQEYVEYFDQLIFPRPSICPRCQAVDRLIGHGFYPRKPLDQDYAYPTRIKRWWCTACHRTTSVLPSFLLRFRHYLVTVIQQVVVARYEAKASWRQLPEQCAPHGAPSTRTMGRWCHSFADHAAGWLAAVQQTLATQDASSPLLNPLGEAAGPLEAPRLLLRATLHLLAWAKVHWAELAGYGLAARLGFLWHWGFSQGLGRLI